MNQPIQMTRAEYEAKYGAPPPASNSAPIQMTRAQYEARYGTSPGGQSPVVKKQGRIKETIQDIKQIGTDISESAKRRSDNLGSTLEARKQGQGLLSTGLQAAGQSMGFASDIVSAGFKGAIKTALPQRGEDALKTVVGKAVTPIMQSGIAQNISKKYESLSPEVKRNIEGGAGIASLVADVAGIGIGSKGARLATTQAGKALSTTGKVLETSGEAGVQAKKLKSLEDLVRPAQTKAVKEAQVARTTETGAGILKKSYIEPTMAEKMAIDEIAKIQGVKAKNTLQQNYNIIKAENVKMAQELESAVKANDFVIPKQEIISKIRASADELAKSPLIVGDAEKTAKKLIDGAIEIINKNEGKGSGLLIARKEFDQWVLSQKPKAFDASSENAFSIANRQIRDTMTEILDNGAPNAKVRESLRRQHSLYNALDNITPKAANEADTAIMRAWQSASEMLGTKNKAVQVIAAVAGIGGLGAAATFAPAAAVLGGLGFVTYKAGKLILKPELRKAVGEILLKMGNKMQPSDRAIIKELLNDSTIPRQGGRTALHSRTGNSEQISLQKAELLKKSPSSSTLPPSKKGANPPVDKSIPNKQGGFVAIGKSGIR